jgi:AraC family transcriptional regulator
MSSQDRRFGVDDVLHRQAADAGVVVRDIGRSSDSVFALKVHDRPGVYDVPKLDFHRFNIQLTGRQRLVDFRADKLSRPAPSQATAGTISFVPAGRALQAVTKGDDFHAFRVLIPRPLMRRTLEQVLGKEVDDEDSLLCYIGAPTDRVHRLTYLLHDEFQAPGKGDAMMMEALAQALAVELGRHFATQCQPTNARSIFNESDRARVMALLDEAVDGSLSLGDIAAALDLEPYRLSRLFRASFGESPRRYLLRKRLAQARRLLEETEEPLAEIAVACGFASQAHMTTSFAQAIGTTPARYRAARESGQAQAQSY